MPTTLTPSERSRVADRAARQVATTLESQSSGEDGDDDSSN
ncbi:hypothetical protein [Natronobacterium gregoryi]|nr:hypothetical protein [Natronobacterium gregoryi]